MVSQSNRTKLFLWFHVRVKLQMITVSHCHKQNYLSACNTAQAGKAGKSKNESWSFHGDKKCQFWSGLYVHVSPSTGPRSTFFHFSHNIIGTEKLKKKYIYQHNLNSWHQSLNNYGINATIQNYFRLHVQHLVTPWKTTWNRKLASKIPSAG